MVRVVLKSLSLSLPNIPAVQKNRYPRRKAGAKVLCNHIHAESQPVQPASSVLHALSRDDRSTLACCPRSSYHSLNGTHFRLYAVTERSSPRLRRRPRLPAQWTVRRCAVRLQSRLAWCQLRVALAGHLFGRHALARRAVRWWRLVVGWLADRGRSWTLAPLLLLHGERVWPPALPDQLDSPPCNLQERHARTVGDDRHGPRPATGLLG